MAQDTQPTSNLVTLGKTPECFPATTVEVTLPDGTKCVIPLVYKYRTKKQYGVWLDEIGAQKSGDEGQEFTWAKHFEGESSVKAEKALDALHSWGLSEPLNKESLVQLDDECPAAMVAILRAYGETCRGERLGN